MLRIKPLLQKIEQLAEHDGGSIIGTDLMLDYTRQLYAELLAYKTQLTAIPVYKEIPAPPTKQPAQQPTVPEKAPQPVYHDERPNIIELTIEQPHPTEQIKDIRTLISINDKYQIISELFSNKKDEYEVMADRLNTFDTELDALKWLQDNLYFEYSWREDSEALAILHSILHKFY